MELSNLNEWLEIASKGATLLAALLAVFGLNAWRRDFTGKRKIELAEEMLQLFYEAADAIDYMRSPMAFSSEMDHVVRQPNESDSRFNARQSVAPFFKRYSEHNELFASLKTLRYRAMARYGSEAEEPFKNLTGLVNRIVAAAHAYVAAANDLYSSLEEDDERLRRYSESQRRRESFFWSIGFDDEVSRELKMIISSVELHCRPYIVPTPAASQLRRIVEKRVASAVTLSKRWAVAAWVRFKP